MLVYLFRKLGGDVYTSNTMVLSYNHYWISYFSTGKIILYA